MSTPVQDSSNVEVQDSSNVDDQRHRDRPRKTRRPRRSRSATPLAQAQVAPPTAASIRDVIGEQQLPEAEPAPPRSDPAPRMPTGGPNIDWHSVLMPPQAQRVRNAAPPGVDGIDVDWSLPFTKRKEFEGDTAIKALRHRLSLDPEYLSAPPLRGKPSSVMPTLGRLSLVVSVAALVACGIAMLSVPEARPAIFKQDPSAALASLLGGLHGSQQPTPRLIVEGRQTFANEALALGVSLNGAIGSEFALLTGLASGTHFSVGGPFGANGWRIPARELGRAVAFAPKDFVGVMDAAIDLRLPDDRLVDSQVMRLEWVPKQQEVRRLAPPPERGEARTVFQPLDGTDVAMLVKRGQDYLKIGDIVSARLVLRRAASARSAQAAFMLGASFDPAVLAELGVLGFAPDAAQARVWYQRAAEFGSTEAPRRIERLARLAN